MNTKIDPEDEVEERGEVGVMANVAVVAAVEEGGQSVEDAEDEAEIAVDLKTGPKMLQQTPPMPSLWQNTTPRHHNLGHYLRLPSPSRVLRVNGTSRRRMMLLAGADTGLILMAEHQRGLVAWALVLVLDMSRLISTPCSPGPSGTLRSNHFRTFICNHHSHTIRAIILIGTHNIALLETRSGTIKDGKNMDRRLGEELGAYVKYIGMADHKSQDDRCLSYCF